ncbi:hypothetical protein M409DRAFT_61287 [Zasmidium cellare ATCC 36951]|uniref:Uncharacterized protein n=1 Tax=Zasmidium cellare ATCC 36951 TaxID=1080233 RepID=A0A6A6BZK3_ZASCE|nr:uncharacterized protein M409DRAFT_61287 [Zasmidium cellare ATCC 36951]KAF2158866.1 hypothetical protein M409DRAFT_61287 [Zasmidium cellare ATCC 36951]
MSTSQLWAPKPQRPSQQHTIERIDRPSNMIPGTWLQLSPDASPGSNTAKFLQLTPQSSPLPSPALKGESASPVDLTSLSLTDSLPRPTTERYLSNTSAVSRQSSVSSSSSNSVSTRPPAFLTVPSVERREMAIGRLGGLGAAFLSN